MMLQTKLHPPPLAHDLLARPRLAVRLDAALTTTLTLVAAPAGYGKTSLVTGWLATPSGPARSERGQTSSPHICWLSLDAYDDDPNRFWQGVLAALQRAVPGLGVDMASHLDKPALPPPPQLLATLLNEVAALPQALLLVLDDYHHVAARAIHDGVRYLLDHAPPQLHLLLTTRADPPLALARLRAQGQLTELRAADLRFTAAEAEVFLRASSGFTLTPEMVQTLMARTEGWITGLKLAALSLAEERNPKNFFNELERSRRYIIEYLTEEVLHRQPASLQAFLAQTSILGRVCGDLCDAVTDRSDSGQLLALLRTRELFIAALDDAGEWFRYHPLLADLLRGRLAQRSSTTEIQALHGRASRWFAARREWEPAIDHALHAAEWSRAADLVTAAYHPLLAQGRVASWQRWLNRLPEDVLAGRPILQMRRGWAAFLNGDVGQAEVLLTGARQAMTDAATSGFGDADTQAFFGELAGYLANVAFFHQEPTDIMALAQDALALAPVSDLARRSRATAALGLGVSLAGDTVRAMSHFDEAATLARAAANPFLQAHALELVADGQIHTARLHAAAATCREIIDLAGNGPANALPFASTGHVKLASILVEQAAWAEAEAELATSRTRSRAGGIGYNQLLECIVELRLYQALGNKDAALAALRRAEAIVRQGQSDLMRVQLATAAVPFWLQAGNVATAAVWVEDLAPLPIIVEEVQQVNLARVRLAQNRGDEARAIAARYAPEAEAAGRLARVIEFSLVSALAYQRAGDQERAQVALGKALTLAEPAAYRQIFVEAGAPVGRLLAARQVPQQTAYVRALRRLLSPDSSPDAQPLIEALSAREREVLQLIAAGLSNKQIAEELVISLNTVKKHSTHIYGKLGVSGRTQAVARAQALHLL